MLSFESVLSLGTSADVLKGTVKGQQASHHFKYYEVRANCIVLLIVLSLWERGVFMAVLWPKCLLSLRSILRGCQSEAILGVLARLLVSVYPRNVKYTNKISGIHNRSRKVVWDTHMVHTQQKKKTYISVIPLRRGLWVLKV